MTLRVEFDIALDAHFWQTHWDDMDGTLVSRANTSIEVYFTRAGKLRFARRHVGKSVETTTSQRLLLIWLRGVVPAFDSVSGHTGHAIRRDGELVLFQPLLRSAGRAYWCPDSRIHVKGL